jgi:hypothetical protein
MISHFPPRHVLSELWNMFENWEFDSHPWLQILCLSENLFGSINKVLLANIKRHSTSLRVAYRFLENGSLLKPEAYICCCKYSPIEGVHVFCICGLDAVIPFAPGAMIALILSLVSQYRRRIENQQAAHQPFCPIGSRRDAHSKESKRKKAHSKAGWQNQPIPPIFRMLSNLIQSSTDPCARPNEGASLGFSER